MQIVACLIAFYSMITEQFPVLLLMFDFFLIPAKTRWRNLGPDTNIFVGQELETLT